MAFLGTGPRTSMEASRNIDKIVMEKDSSPLLDLIVSELFIFLGLVLLVGEYRIADHRFRYTASYMMRGHTRLRESTLWSVNP